MTQWHLVKCEGETIRVSSDKALYRPSQKSLLVSDPHFGKAASFHSLGVPVPAGHTQADLDRLTLLVEETEAEKLIILGDFFHHRTGQCETTMRTIASWIGAHPRLRISLVMGNHDRSSTDPPPEWGIRIHRTPFFDPPFLFCHEPCSHPEATVLCGHIHPAVFLRDESGFGVRLPCFLFSRKQILFPAFGSFTGTCAVKPEKGDLALAVYGDEIFPIRF